MVTIKIGKYGRYQKKMYIRKVEFSQYNNDDEDNVKRYINDKLKKLPVPI